jgi:hypothetical protein
MSNGIFSILVRGFAPNYDSNKYSSLFVQKMICQIKVNSNNGYSLWWHSTLKSFVFTKTINGSAINLVLSSSIFNNFQTTNLLIEQTTNGMRIRALTNTLTILEATNTDTNIFTGLASLYPLQSQNNDCQADAFLDNIVYMPNQTFDDTTAESILRGTKEGFEFPELFDINAVTLHANATKSNGVITLNATGANQYNYLDISVLPNNQYQLLCNTTGTNATIDIQEKYNNIFLKDNAFVYSTNGLQTITITTSAKTNIVRLYFYSTATGTFTFSNISLKIKM